MPRLTPKQTQALELLADGPLTEAEITAKVRRDVLQRLAEEGLIKFQPHAKPQAAWRLLAPGRNLVQQAAA